jgi:hypothetical protein
MHVDLKLENNGIYNMQPSDINIHKLFLIETLMHTNTSSKTTHSIKRSLIKTMLYMLMQWACSLFFLMGISPRTSWELTQVHHGN